MKKQVLYAVILLFSLALTTTGAMAQRNNEPRGPRFEASDDDRPPFCAGIPDLTDEQKTRIEKLRTEHLKKVNVLQASIQEKRAQINTLRLADDPDMKKIYSVIDEIAELKADLMKERESHRQAIRENLTDEQKVAFDSRGNGRGPGFRHGRGPGHCDGMGPRHDGFGYGPGKGRGRWND